MNKARPNRLPVRSRHARKFFESLERRTMLHGSVAELLELGVPESMLTEGHISKADFATLTAAQQAHIDPHLIEGNTAGEVMDYDALLGIPLSHGGTGRPAGSEAGLAGGPEVDALPDFFPQLDSAISVDQGSQPGRTLLRFGTQVNNQGAGPAIFISANPGSPIPTGAPITTWVNPDGSQNVLQAIYSYNGSTFSLSHYRAGGRFTYHAGHGHFHYDGYAYYALRHRNTDGTVGAYVQRPDGTGVVGEKTGFCLINTSSSFTTEAGTSSTLLPGYGAAGQPATGCGFLQGVRVGHADEYTSGLTGQWIDVTGVPNGQYFVELTMDGENALLESNENNNSKSYAYTLNVNPPGGGIAPDVFDSGGANNNTFATAADMGVLGVETIPNLTIHWGLDYDYFKFTASSSGSYTIRTTPNIALPNRGNVDLYLYDAGETQLAASTIESTGADTITYNFVAGQEYFVKAMSYNSTLSGGYALAWNLLPAVQAAAQDPVGNELGDNSAVVRVGRNGPVTSPLTINFSVTGTATRGTDYELYHDGVLVSGNTLTIGNLAQQGDLEVRPIYDSTPEAPETVTITLNNSAAYVIGAGGATATVTIGDAGPEVTQTTQTWQVSPHKLVFDIARGLASTVDGADFLVWNLDTNQPVNPQALSAVQNGDNAIVTMTFNGVLPDGRYRATLTGAGVTNSLGDPMFADFAYDFFVLTGDANHDGRINLDDFNVLAANFGQSGRDGSTGDFTYDGISNLDDFNVLAAKFGTNLNIGTTASNTGALPPRGGTSNPGKSGSPFSDGKVSGGDDDDRLSELA